MGIDEDTADLPKETPWYARILIANIRDAWRFASVQWPVLCAAATEAYAANQVAVDEWFTNNVPKGWMPHLLAAAFAVSIIVRVVKQKGK